jgi:hypothetical protein
MNRRNEIGELCNVYCSLLTGSVVCREDREMPAVLRTVCLRCVKAHRKTQFMDCIDSVNTRN